MLRFQVSRILCLNAARLILQIPIAPEQRVPSEIGAGGDVGSRPLPERIDERSSGVAGCQITTVQHQVRVAAKGSLPPANHVGIAAYRLGIEPRATDLQSVGGSVRQQMQGVQVVIPP